MSVYDAFDYVLDHYYPAKLEEYAVLRDNYAVISIQDTHTEGFGFVFSESMFCRGVLTLYFDDMKVLLKVRCFFRKSRLRISWSS